MLVNQIVPVEMKERICIHCDRVTPDSDPMTYLIAGSKQGKSTETIRQAVFRRDIILSTEYDFYNSKVNIVEEIKYSNGERSNVRVYGSNDVREGVAIMQLEDVDVSITGNSTNPTRFQHPVAGIYKKECMEKGKKYFSVASGGGTGRTLHPDNMAAGPASYGMTDTMGRMHGDAQFAGSSSVPAHVEMMGLIGMGNNPMVGATVSVAVAVEMSFK